MDRLARSQIEKLRSDDLPAREEGERALEALEEKAIPFLEQAAKDRDSEVAERAARLLRTIRIAGRLSPELKKTFPGIARGLTSGEGHVWTEFFLKAVAAEGGKRLHPTLRNRDIEILAVQALQNARWPEERDAVIVAASVRNLRSAIPELVAALRTSFITRSYAQGSEDLGYLVENELRNLNAKEAVPFLRVILREGRAENDRILRSGSNQKRCLIYAIRALGHLHALEARPDLVGLLRSGYLAGDVACALAEMGARDLAPDIAPLLADRRSESRRLGAVRALRMLGAREYGMDIARLVTDPDISVRRAAIESVAPLGVREAIPQLILALDDLERGNRIAAIHALEAFGASKAVPAMMKKLTDSDFPYFASGIGVLATQEQCAQVLSLLKAQGPALLPGVLWTVGKTGMREALPEILPMLKRPDLRSYAIRALGELGSPELVGTLAPFLKSEESGDRIAAIEALDKLFARSEAAALSNLLKDSDAYVRMTAGLTLARLSGTDSVPAILALKEDPDPTVKFNSATTMAILIPTGSETGAKCLAERLADARPDIRGTAAELLGRMGVGQAAPRIRNLLEDDDAGVGLRAALALASLGQEDGRSAVVRFLSHKVEWIRWRAVRALGLLAGESVEEIKPLLGDPAPRVRREAALALARMGYAEGVSTALELSEPFTDWSSRYSSQVGNWWRCDAWAQSEYTEDLSSVTALNRLRRPVPWRLLQEKTLKEDMILELKSILQRIATDAGLQFEFAELPPGVERQLARRHWIRARPLKKTLLEALEEALLELPVAFILEEGRIRFVTSNHALGFWNDWWKQK